MPTHIHNQRGVALLLTLVILALLTAVVVEFDYGARINLITAGNFRDGVRASYLAKAGIRAGQALLMEDKKKPDLFRSFKTQTCLDVGSLMGAGAISLGEGTARVSICDESGRLPVMRLARPGGAQIWKPMFIRLFQNLEIDPEVVDAITDWVDDNEDPSGSLGAESDYYARQIPAYSAQNGPMISLGELRLIRGVTKEVYEKLTAGCEGQPCITIVDTTKINLNTLSVMACRALHDGLTEDCCKSLVDHRPIKDMTADLPPCWGGLGGVYSDIRADLVQKQIPISTESDHYQILSVGEVNGVNQKIEALVNRGTPKMSIMSWVE